MKKTLIILLGLVMLSHTVAALMPPMEDNELEKDSNTIVKGEIIQVESLGKKESNQCATHQNKLATLKISEVIKSSIEVKKDQTVMIHFRDTKFKEGCVGSPDHKHYKGETGTFYLSCKDPLNCRLTHWNGVKK